MAEARSRARDDDRVFLFSIDLEDVRVRVPGGDRFAERVPANVERYLELLATHDLRCTFFTVGDVARRYPSLVRQIASAGHEIACHTSDHLPLDRQDRDSLRDDLSRNIDDLMKAGAGQIVGFRAPVMSLTRRTEWAYEILAELGFIYSSSVLPGANPLYGWPGFGDASRRMPGGVWEIPLSLSDLPGVRLPFAGGVYFRVLPFPLVRYLFHRCTAAGKPVIGYFHPYDLDEQQERFMHPEIDDNRLYNALLYYRRAKVVPRLRRLLAGGLTVQTYERYVRLGLVEHGAGVDSSTGSN